MPKVVINTCFGGFGLSPKALRWLWEHGVKEIGTPVEEYFKNDKAALKRALTAKEGMFTTLSADKKFALYGSDLKRDNPLLVRVVEEMGKDSYGDYAELSVVDVPDGVEWGIHEYDGSEHVEEAHRTWR